MNKKAIVTGGSDGIGKAFAVQLARDGYIVTVVARNETKLRELTGQMGSSHSFHVADLSSEEGLSRIQKIIEAGNFNLLVNNAGVGTVGDFTDVSLERQMAMFRLNCEAVVRLSFSFLRNSKSGDALINVSSALAFMPTPSMAVYSATKSFVTAFSDSLWYEQRKRGVYVMGLCPGITDTGFAVASGGKLEDLPKGLSQTPEQVVQVALNALAARKNPTILTGFKNVFFAVLTRILSRRVVVQMTGAMMPEHPQTTT
ncbi:MAG: SDR family NAD(P)-dependent oxidoreductase [Deltaproteobacteria bacterium]|jgi:short-subunit dehydrogenase|nr:SDR family NAD(P)-dependent oxidoreductase [Deltaproteobacteria bacterium]